MPDSPLTHQPLSQRHVESDTVLNAGLSEIHDGESLELIVHNPYFAHVSDAKQDEDDVSSDDIANLSKCSNTYDLGNHHDWPKDLNSKSLGEDEQELSSSDSVGMNVRRQDEDTAALENRLENQMTLKADVKRSPSDDELFTLSRKLDTFNKGWWFLAKLLGLSDDKIDELEHGGADIIRQYYKMLTAWRNQNTGQEKGSVGYLLRQCDEAGIDR